MNEDESEEEAVQKGEKAVIDTSNLQCKELESGNGPFVIDCADCPTGLSVQEQVTWARSTDHPMMEFPKVAADTHWWKAIAFEVENDADEIDAWRERVLNRYEKMVVDLEPGRKEWLRGSPKP